MNAPFLKTTFTVAVVLLLVFGSGSIGLLLSKMKINIGKAVDKADEAMPIFDKMAGLVEELLPKPYKAVAQTVTAIIREGVTVAEELWKCGQLSADERKAYALTLIHSALPAEGVQADDDVNKAVSLAVDVAAKLFLAKSHPNASENAADGSASKGG